MAQEAGNTRVSVRTPAPGLWNLLSEKSCLCPRGQGLTVAWTLHDPTSQPHTRTSQSGSGAPSPVTPNATRILSRTLSVGLWPCPLGSAVWSCRMTASPLRDTAGGGGAEKGATEREMEKGTDGERREGGRGRRQQPPRSLWLQNLHWLLRDSPINFKIQPFY